MPASSCGQTIWMRASTAVQTLRGGPARHVRLREVGARVGAVRPYAGSRVHALHPRHEVEFLARIFRAAHVHVVQVPIGERLAIDAALLRQIQRFDRIGVRRLPHGRLGLPATGRRREAARRKQAQPDVGLIRFCYRRKIVRPDDFDASVHPGPPVGGFRRANRCRFGRRLDVRAQRPYARGRGAHQYTVRHAKIHSQGLRQVLADAQGHVLPLVAAVGAAVDAATIARRPEQTRRPRIGHQREDRAARRQAIGNRGPAIAI